MSSNNHQELNNVWGQVITFYSYKGGTGRSMALANTACILAQDSNNKGILVIDWDLEAPGQHYYFRDLLAKKYTEGIDSELAINEHVGLIDLFLELKQMIPDTNDRYEGQTTEEAVATLEKIDLNRFIMPTDNPNLFLLKAGRFDKQYSTNVNTFNWENFYNRSPQLIRIWAEKLTTQYQYVLVDSRTGLTDISNICTSLMPEKLVVVFTPNRQSLMGIKGLVKQAVEYRESSHDQRPLMVFPLPSRIDVSIPKLEEKWQLGNSTEGITGYQPLFEELFKQVYELDECSLDGYFKEVKLQHVADYAYGEEIVVLKEGEEGDDRLSLATSYKVFVEKLLKFNAPWEVGQVSNLKPFDVYISYNSEDKSEINVISKLLTQRGVKVWLNEEQIPPGASFRDALQRGTSQTRAVAIFIGVHGIGEWQGEELHAFHTGYNIPSGMHVIPVLLPGVNDIRDDITLLKTLKWVKFNSLDDTEALNQLIWGITGVKPQNQLVIPATNIPKINKSQLIAILSNLSEDELWELGYDIGVDLERIEGSDKRIKIRNIIKFFDMREQLPKLVEQANKMHPNLFKVLT